MAWRRPGDKPLSEPMMVNLLTPICVAWPLWVKDLSYLFRWKSFEMGLLIDNDIGNYKLQEFFFSFQGPEQSEARFENICN